MPKTTRDRMLEAAVDAMRRRGVAGMSFSEVLAASGAARGAIYHHFPGGKAQLVAEATERNGQAIRARFEQLPASTPHRLVADFLALVRPVVAESTTGSGCAVAAAAMDYDAEGGLSTHSAAAFRSWVEVLAERLVSTGLSEAEAEDLATTLITLLEGAHVLCRASASIEPFDRACRTVDALVETRFAGRVHPG